MSNLIHQLTGTELIAIIKAHHEVADKHEALGIERAASPKVAAWHKEQEKLYRLDAEQLYWEGIDAGIIAPQGGAK